MWRMFFDFFKTKSHKDYSGYRSFYLKTDVHQSKAAIMLTLFPLIGFLLSDFQLYGFSYPFFALLTFRLIILLIIGLEILYIGKAKTYRSYDRAVFLSVLALIISGGIINLTRPENYIFHSFVTIISIFVVSLVVPLKFSFKTILVLMMAAGETAIIMLSAGSVESLVLYTVFFSLFSATAIAGLASWQMQSYRIRGYEESIERKKLQESLQEQAAQLAALVKSRDAELVETQQRLMKSERLAAIGAIAAMVGHDLRNPLSGIKNACYYLRKKQGDFVGDDGLKMLGIIDKSIKYADKIIDDLLDYGREIHLEKERSSPKVLIDYVLLTLKVPKDVRIQEQVDASVLLDLDPGKMQRVFTNLIKNAFDAMPNGGTLEIIGERVNNDFLVSFADTGIGMTDETIDKIFTPLFTTKAQGMGLGLPICKRILEAHGGTIGVVSVVGKGTTFIAKLPLNVEK
jgi:signal transduction histidine kinase